MQYVMVLRLHDLGSDAFPRYGMLFRLPDDDLHEAHDRLLDMILIIGMSRTWQH
jgi:hypothetical protein